MKSEQQILEDINVIEENTLLTAGALLRKYNHNMRDYLAAFVADICDVNVCDMLQASSPSSIVFARWLYWYAYRYMTNESYDTIAVKLGKPRMFTPTNISLSVTKMSMMINNEPIWGKRWSITKKVVKAILRTSDSEMNGAPIKVKITHPKGVSVELKQE